MKALNDNFYTELFFCCVHQEKKIVLSLCGFGMKTSRKSLAGYNSGSAGGSFSPEKHLS